MISGYSFERNWRAIFLFSCLVCGLTVSGMFTLFYLAYGHDGLPAGWDTPRYVAQMLFVSNKGPLGFIQRSEYYNPGYGIFSSFFVFARLSPFVVETVVPVALCLFIVVMSGILVKALLKDGETAVYTMLFAASWFAVYRLGADLHANLLAMAFLLLGSYFFLSGFERESRKRVRFWLLPFLFLASFTHVETTAFFTLVLVVCAVLLQRLTPSRYSLKEMLIDVSLMVLVVMPSVVFYVQHLRNLLSYTGGVLISNPPSSIQQWISYIGITFPIAFLGLYLALRNISARQYSAYNAFVSVWVLASISFALAQYAFPTIQIFADRALMLFPAPFVAAIGLKAIFGKVRLPELPRASFNSRAVVGAGLVFVIFVSSVAFTYALVMPVFKVWLSSSAYQRLTWLSTNYRSEDSPVFVLNDFDEYAGGLGVLYNDWIQAIYGDHYAYLGRLDFLFTLTETPFKSLVSQQTSALFLQRMRNDNIFSVEGLLSHRVIVIADFYEPRPLPIYDAAIFDEVYDGIFVLNATKLSSTKSLYVPLYVSVWEETGEWNYTERNWTRSVYALEFSDLKPSNQEFVQTFIFLASPGNYSLVLRYWDGNGSDVMLFLNNSLLGEIHYGETYQPNELQMHTTVESAGTYLIKIIVTYIPTKQQYASLDYLQLTLEDG